MKVSYSALLIFSVIVCSALLNIANAAASLSPVPTPSPPLISTPPGVPSYCLGKCDNRCSRNYRKKFCMQLCMTCCKKCDCVPSGPYADKSECPCYRDMKNKKGNPKCP